MIIKKICSYLNIKNTLFIPLLIEICVFSILVSILTTFVANHVLKENMLTYLKDMQTEVNVNLELTLNQVVLYATRYLGNPKLIDLLENKRLTQLEKQNQLPFLIKGDFDDRLLYNISFITTQNQLLYYNNRTPPPQVLSSEDLGSTLTWLPMAYPQKQHSPLRLSIPIYNPATFKRIGYAIMDLKEHVLRSAYEKSVPVDSDTFLLDHNGFIISHTNASYIGNRIFDMHTYRTNKDINEITFNNRLSILAIQNYATSLRKYNANWSLVTIVPKESLFRPINTMRKIILYFTFCIVLLASFLCIKTCKQLSLSIINLNDKIKLFITKGFVGNMSHLTKNEIVELDQAYDQLIHRIQLLIKKNNMEKEKQRELELHALQSQINPHFLYNTLDAIAWIAKLKKQKDIEKLVISLSRFFRISLHNGDKYITVEEELHLAESYIAIEKIRFPEKINFNVQVDEEVLDLSILKLTLQPFIENAIKHGISKKSGLGTILVKGYLEKDDLVFQVTDNGPGCPSCEEFFRPPKRRTTGGYGITNVQERIKLEYGMHYGISVDTQVGVGTTITIRLHHSPQI